MVTTSAVLHCLLVLATVGLVASVYRSTRESDARAQWEREVESVTVTDAHGEFVWLSCAEQPNGSVTCSYRNDAGAMVIAEFRQPSRRRRHY
jgi:hypothetical protein